MGGFSYTLETISSAANTTHSNGAAKKLSDYDKGIEILARVYQCQNKDYIPLICVRMKLLLKHILACKKQPRDTCRKCEHFMTLNYLHAVNCDDIKCPVVFCSAIKKHLIQFELTHGLEIADLMEDIEKYIAINKKIIVQQFMLQFSIIQTLMNGHQQNPFIHDTNNLPPMFIPPVPQNYFTFPPGLNQNHLTIKDDDDDDGGGDDDDDDNYYMNDDGIKTLIPPRPQYSPPLPPTCDSNLNSVENMDCDQNTDEQHKFFIPPAPPYSPPLPPMPEPNLNFPLIDKKEPNNNIENSCKFFVPPEIPYSPFLPPVPITLISPVAFTLPHLLNIGESVTDNSDGKTNSDNNFPLSLFIPPEPSYPFPSANVKIPDTSSLNLSDSKSQSFSPEQQSFDASLLACISKYTNPTTHFQQQKQKLKHSDLLDPCNSSKNSILPPAFPLHLLPPTNHTLPLKCTKLPAHASSSANQQPLQSTQPSTTNILKPQYQIPFSTSSGNSQESASYSLPSLEKLSIQSPKILQSSSFLQSCLPPYPHISPQSPFSFELSQLPETSFPTHPPLLPDGSQKTIKTQLSLLLSPTTSTSLNSNFSVFETSKSCLSSSKESTSPFANTALAISTSSSSSNSSSSTSSTTTASSSSSSSSSTSSTSTALSSCSSSSSPTLSSCSYTSTTSSLSLSSLSITSTPASSYVSTTSTTLTQSGILPKVSATASLHSHDDSSSSSIPFEPQQPPEVPEHVHPTLSGFLAGMDEIIQLLTGPNGQHLFPDELQQNSAEESEDDDNDNIDDDDDDDDDDVEFTLGFNNDEWWHGDSDKGGSGQFMQWSE